MKRETRRWRVKVRVERDAVLSTLEHISGKGGKVKKVEKVVKVDEVEM